MTPKEKIHPKVWERLRQDLKYWFAEFKLKSHTLFSLQILFLFEISRFVTWASVLVTYILTTYLVFFDRSFHDYDSPLAILIHVADVVYIADFAWKVAFEEVHLFRYKFQPEGPCEDFMAKLWKRFKATVQIVSLLPLEYIAYGWKNLESENWLLTFALLRLNRLVRLRYLYFSYVRDRERNCVSMPGRAWKTAFLPFITCGILIYHAVACFWYYLNCEASIFNNVPPVCGPWMHKYYDYVNEFGQKGYHPFYRYIAKSRADPYGHYIGCLLWSVMTIRNPGNFYYPPSSYTEMIYNITFSGFTFLMQFLILLASINLMISTDLPRLLFHTEMKGVNNFLRYLNLHKTILSDVLECFDTVWNRRRVFTDKGLRPLLTPCLEQTVYMEKAAPIFWASELLQTFTRTALEALAPSVEFKSYFAGEYLFRPSTLGKNMKFLISGYAQIIDPDDNRRIMTFSNGALIGEVNIICPCYRHYGVQALTDCEAIIVSFKAVNEILNIDTAMRRQMHLIILRRLDFVCPREDQKDITRRSVFQFQERRTSTSTSRPHSWTSLQVLTQEDETEELDTYVGRHVSLFTYRRYLRETKFDESQYNECDEKVAEQMTSKLRNRASNSSYRFAKEVWTPRYNFGFWKGCAVSKDTLFFHMWNVFSFVYIIVHSIWLMVTILNFHPSSNTSVMVINYITDVVYALDVFFLLFMFRDRWEVTSKAEIIQYMYHFNIEIRNPRAWFDIIAIFPIWCFSPEQPPPQWMRFNMLFKFFCVFYKARELEQEVTYSAWATRVIKHATNFMGFVVLTAFVATLFRCAETGYKKCVMEPSKQIALRYNLNNQGESILGVFMYWAVCVVFGIGFKDIHNRTHESEFYIAAYLVGFALLISCWAELISTYVEMSEVKMKYEKARVWMRHYFARSFSDPVMIKSVDTFIVNQWRCWRGIEYSADLEENKGFITIGHSVYNELIVQTVVDAIYSVGLFKWMQPNMIREFSLASQLLCVGSHRVIIPYGDAVRRLYIIRRGVVEITLISGQSCPIIQKLGAGNCLGFGEMAFKIPSLIHVRSLSDVELIVIDASAFERVFAKSKFYSRVWTKFVKNPINMKAYKRFLTPRGFTPIVRYRDKLQEEKVPIIPALNFFKRPGYTERKLKIGNPKWTLPWKRAAWWIRIFRPFSLRFTIHPMKITEKIWETFRFLVVYLVLFIVPVGEAFPCFKEQVIGLYHFADAVSVADMLVRCYTAYYGPKFSYHPAQTIRNYVTSAFLTDLVGGPAFYYLFLFGLQFAPVDFQDSMFVYFFKLNRIVLMYHVFGYHRQFTTDVWAQSSWRKILKVIPILLFHVHLMSCIFAVSGCPTLTCPYLYPRCEKRTWITNSLFHPHHPIWAGNGSFPTDFEIYAAAFYYSATTSAGCAFGDFAAVNSYERAFMATTLFVYAIGIAFIMGRVVSIQSLKTFNLVTFKRHVNHLMDFMVRESVDYHLKQSIMCHYEHQWHQCRAENPRDHMKTLFPALREEVGFQLYQNAFESIIELQSASEGFLRGICDIANLQFIPMGQVLFREHDTCDTFYILKEGMLLCSKEAYVGTRIKDSGVMGTFGRFNEYTATAIDHLQILSFSKKDFAPLAIIFPEEAKDMRRSVQNDRKEPYNKDTKGKPLSTSTKSIPLKRTMSDLMPLTRKQDKYLETCPSHNLHMIGRERRLNPTFDEPLLLAAQPLNEFDQDFDEPEFNYQTLYRGFVLHQDSTLTVFLNALYFLGALGSVIVVPYQAAFKNFEWYCFGISYALDLVYVTKMIVSFFVSSVNDDGIIVTDRADIGVKYFGHFKGFTYDLITIFPFEVLAPASLLDSKANDIWYILSVCRLNRILRLKHVWEYFNPKEFNSGYNVEVTKLKICRMIVLTAIYVHLMTCLLQFWTLFQCSSTTHSKFKPDWDQCLYQFKNTTWLGTKGDDKFLEHLYIYALYFVVSIFTATAYGDVRAMSEFEMVFASVMAISSKAWLALALADLVGGLHFHLEPKSTYALAVSETLADYKYDGATDYTLQRVAKQLEAVWVFSRGVVLPEYVVSLPPGLKKDLFFFLYEKHIMKSYLFYNLPDNFCRELCMQFQRMMVLQGEYIIKSGQIGDRMYFIHSGTVSFRKTYPVDIQRGNYKKNEGRVSFPRHFGEENAFLGRRRYHCAYMAETDCELLFLDNVTLMRLFQPNFRDIEKIVMKRFERVYKIRRGFPEKCPVAHNVKESQVSAKSEGQQKATSK